MAGVMPTQPHTPTPYNDICIFHKCTILAFMSIIMNCELWIMNYKIALYFHYPYYPYRSPFRAHSRTAFLAIKKALVPKNRTKAASHRGTTWITNRSKALSERCHSYPHNVRNTSFLLSFRRSVCRSRVLFAKALLRGSHLFRALCEWNTCVTSPGHSVWKILYVL